LELPVIPKVPRPTAKRGGPPLDEYNQLEYVEALKERNIKAREIEQLNMTLFSVVWSQCSSTMREQLQGMTEFTNTDGQSNGIALLKAIKSVSYNYMKQHTKWIQSTRLYYNWYYAAKQTT
jgi:hypothetical protein